LVAWSSGGNSPSSHVTSAGVEGRGELLAGERSSKSESNRRSVRYRNGDESNWGAPLDSSGSGFENDVFAGAFFPSSGSERLIDDGEGICDADDVPRMLCEQADAITRLEDEMRCRDRRIDQLEAELAKMRPREFATQPAPAVVPSNP
jgi:hypothetical protein